MRKCFKREKSPREQGDLGKQRWFVVTEALQGVEVEMDLPHQREAK